ncbi:protein ALP1-like isoform X1 [Mercurialis annua]|uniref:protein ALP1-like isoform X1 n=1 Tax=Mercurialis annua TaxID=3986 RepID=UPI00215DFDBF|nr:protein ALP1-like isoform X1 [Mercurialis annua]
MDNNLRGMQIGKKRTRDEENTIMEEKEELDILIFIINFITMIVGASYHHNYRLRDISWDKSEHTHRRSIWMQTLESETTSIELLRVNPATFKKLCGILQSEGGLVASRNITIKEIVALFLHILGHGIKYSWVKACYARSGETISRQFHVVLKAVMKRGKYYIREANSNENYQDNGKWKFFEGVLGALDGTHIQMTVPFEDRARYRNRKGDLSTNVLGVCDPKMKFTYVLPGWEGSATDPRILGEALHRRNRLKIPSNKYYLVDGAYTNGPGFLAPYRGTRYHLNLWRGNRPTNYKELFNLRHSSARNTIERAFGLLKKRWAILRAPSFFDKQTQVRIINACFILHNFIREEMTEDDLLKQVDEELANSLDIENEIRDEENIRAIRLTHEWTTFRDNLAMQMFNEYQAR